MHDMPTLNYLSSPPQLRTVASARIHLLVWSIVYFFLAFVVAVYGMLALVLVTRENRGVDRIVLSAIALALYGGCTYLFVTLGLHCLRAYTGLHRRDITSLKPAITLCTILSALGLFAMLWSGALLVSTFIFEKYGQPDGFWPGVVCGSCILLTILVTWSKRTVIKARDSLDESSSSR
jgi:hypothetical protein